MKTIAETTTITYKAFTIECRTSCDGYVSYDIMNRAGKVVACYGDWFTAKRFMDATN